MVNSKKKIMAGIVVCAVSGSVSASSSVPQSLNALTSAELNQESTELSGEIMTQSFNSQENTLASDDGGKQKKRHKNSWGWLEKLIKGDNVASEHDENFS